MKRLFGLFLTFVLCISLTPSVDAYSNDLVQFIGDSYTQGYTSEGMIVGYNLWYVQVCRKAHLKYTAASYGGVGFVKESDARTFSTLLDEGKGKRNAKYVVITGGYNDKDYSYKTIKNKVYETVKKAQTLYPKAKVYVGMTGDSVNKHFKTVIQAYKDGTKEAGGTYITNSENALNGNQSYFSSDGHHPNKYGQRALGETIGGYFMKCNNVPVYTKAASIKIGAGIYAVKNRHFINITGLYDNYYMVNGIVDTSKTGIVENDGEYYKMDEGKVDTSYTGIWSYNDQQYYLTNGHTDKTMTGSIKANKTWYYVENGVVANKDTLMQIDDQWYYVHQGKMDKSYTGLVEYNGQNYYVVNGMVDFSKTGMIHMNGQLCYIKNGVLENSYSNSNLYNGSWYYIHGDEIRWLK